MAELGQNKEDLEIELVLADGSKFQQVGKIGAIVADFNTETGDIPSARISRTRTGCCVTVRPAPC